jgi:hypothetical protein
MLLYFDRCTTVWTSKVPSSFERCVYELFLPLNSMVVVAYEEADILINTRWKMNFNCSTNEFSLLTVLLTA